MWKEYFAGHKSKPGENGFVWKYDGFIRFTNTAANGQTVQLKIEIGSNINFAKHWFSQAYIGL